MNINKILNSNEKVEYKAKISLVPFLVGVIIAAIIGVIGLILQFIYTNAIGGIVFYIIAGLVLIYSLQLLEYSLSTHLYVTDKRVFVRSGILKTTYFEIPRTHISGVSIQQSLFGRIFSYGNIIIESSANISAPKAKYVKNPFELKEMLKVLEVS